MIPVRPGPRRLLIVLLVVAAALGMIRTAAWVRERDDRTPAHLRFVATPLGRIAVDVRGPADGTPVLIVPGTAGWSGFWRDVSAHLAARGYRVIAVDLPPFGYSDRDPSARYDRIAQAARLAMVLRAAAPRPATVLAHSFGGGPAVELAWRHPDRVARLILVDAALGPLDPPHRGGRSIWHRPMVAQPLIAATLTNPHMIGALSRSMLARKGRAAAWRETLRAPMRRSGTTKGYAAWLPALLADDDAASTRRSATLRTLKPPVRLIWGEADAVTPLAEGLHLSRLLHAPILRLPGVGHVPHIEDPAGFSHALDAALSDGGARRPD